MDRRRTERLALAGLFAAVALAAAAPAAADTLAVRLCPSDTAFQATGVRDCETRYLPLDGSVCVALGEDLGKPGAAQARRFLVPKTTEK